MKTSLSNLLKLFMILVMITGTMYSCKKEKAENTQPDPPQITNVQPKNPQPGDVVTITGSGFGNVATSVKVAIGTTEINVTNVTATEIKFSVPESLNPGDLKVTINGNVVVNKDPDGSTINPKVPTPTFTAMTPLKGKTGDVVTLTGTNFSTRISDNKVFFATNTGGTVVLATIKTATATTLTVEVPANAITGGIKISVNSIDAIPATGFNTTFTITQGDVTGGSSVDYIQVVSGGLKFSKIASAAKEIGTMYLDKVKNIIYYTDYSILNQTGTTIYKVNLAGATGPEVLTADTRLSAIQKLTSDANGNVYALKYNGDLSYNVYKISQDGATVTELVKGVTTTANKTSAYYFFVNSKNEICLRPDLKYTSTGERIVGSSSLIGLQMKDGGAIHMGGVAYMTQTTTNADEANKCKFIKWNLETGTYADTDFTLQALFNADDAERFSTSQKIGWLKYATDNNDNMYVMLDHSYIAGSVRKTWMIRKTKNGSGTSASLGSFVLKLPAVDLNDYNSTVEFVSDASGNLYFKANAKDILKITQ
ncbi:IPT/TIG domain-containing protein [Pedobacter foliorum]|uniref:IPT/TIG domain-containing protein n=1 Tax=Pedobacter foliorum TaxID=2739058 RepID=UPI0015651C81|nr:IPT/TIG domain-containing protein [Pedobacter foliorum]NRF38285.1 IPT/TIG domain-containing protein [Pedobacter foliorum]